jgi:hypothetical protein
MPPGTRAGQGRSDITNRFPPAQGSKAKHTEQQQPHAHGPHILRAACASWESAATRVHKCVSRPPLTPGHTEQHGEHEEGHDEGATVAVRRVVRQGGERDGKQRHDPQPHHERAHVQR